MADADDGVPPENPTVAGLFAGIGGIELGLHAAGFSSHMLAEIDPVARRVLAREFGGTELVEDVAAIRRLPHVDVVTAGFPCQDLSQAGSKVGIHGSRSGLVDEVFRLVRGRHLRKSWLVLENVSYMLRLDQGRAMGHLTDSLEELGYRWAYRTVDARGFGLPQRRKRVLVVASRVEDPRQVLFADEAGEPASLDVIGPASELAYGFYWTEGLRGLGWAEEATPTVKGGSGLGIPSPPAVWSPRTGHFGVPSIRDLERLQGFPSDWTRQDDGDRKSQRARYRLVGNAVAVPVASWLGECLRTPREPIVPSVPLDGGLRWPRAAWGSRGKRYAVDASEWPSRNIERLSDFLHDELSPLSLKAAKGFRERAHRGKLRFADGFLASLDRYIAGETSPGAVAEVRVA